MAETWAELKTKKESILTELKKQAKGCFKEVCDKLFEEHPKLQAIGFTQYTPYFNDGDSCEFSSSCSDADIVFDGYKTEYCGGFDDEDEIAEELGLEEIKGEYDDDGKPPVGIKGCEKEVRKALKMFDDDDLLGMFGDHVCVKITRKGIKTSEYLHD